MSSVCDSVYTYFNITEQSDRLSKLYEDNPGGTLFLVPAALDKENLLQLIAGGGSYFGPRPAIFTIGELYRDMSKMCDVQRRVIDPPDHNLILRYLVEKFLNEKESEGTELPAGMKHAGFVSMVGDNIKELLAEDVSPEHLHRTLFDGGDYDTSLPEAVLLRLYTDYLLYLESNSLADAGQIASLMRELLLFDKVSDFIRNRRIVFVGFLSFTGSQIKLVRSLDEMSETYFFQPETGLDDFYDGISQLKKEFSKRSEWNIKVLQLNANNETLQFVSVARELALWAHGHGNFAKLGTLTNYGETAILADSRKLPLLTTSLERYKIPYNLQVRGTVADTPLGELAGRIWHAYISGWKTRDTLSLLKTPILGCGGYDFRHIEALFPDGAESWRNVLKGNPLVLYEKMAELCRSFEKGGTPSEVLSFWRDFIMFFDAAICASKLVGEEVSLDDSVKDISSALNELEKKIEALEDLKRDIGDAAKVVLKGGDAASYVSDWGRTATLPIQLPQNSSVTVFCGIPPVLTTFKYWIMTDIDYKTWPGTLRESPLLGGESKRRVNSFAGEERELPYIPDLHDEREQKEAIFRRLIATAQNGVVLSRSLVDSNKRPIGQSQFTASLLSANGAYVKLENAGTAEYPLSKSIPDFDDYVFKDAEIALSMPKVERGEIPRAGRTAPNEEEIPSVSLSALDDWITCPFKYWCRYVLKLDFPANELYDRRRAGIFLHRLWEIALNESSVSENSISNIVMKHYDAVAKECYQELTSDRRLLRYNDRLKDQVADLAEQQDEIENRIKGRRTRIATEYELKEYVFCGVKFKGRADRIDFYDNSAVVLDYKSNKSEAHKNELQLAAYALLLRETEGITPAGYGWFGHADKRLLGYFASQYEESYFVRRKTRQKDLSKLLDDAQNAMSEMASSILEGKYRANYGSDGCPLCPYYTVCRKREIAYSNDEENENDTEASGDE